MGRSRISTQCQWVGCCSLPPLVVQFTRFSHLLLLRLFSHLQDRAIELTRPIQKKMDDEKFVHGFIVRSSTDAPKRFWFFSQMMSVAIPKWGLMSYLDELISLRVCRSRDWRTWNQKFWTWLVLWLLSREISETCRFWFASGIVCTWNQVSPSVFSLKECESNSLREISAQLRLTGLLFCVVSSRNYTVWSRGSWLGGALVSA
jgi:hypothetical protein